MTINDVIPIITSLSHTEKLRLTQLILSQLAKEEGVSLLASTSEQQDPLLDIIGIAEGESTDVAREHDAYLYGAS